MSTMGGRIPPAPAQSPAWVAIVSTRARTPERGIHWWEIVFADDLFRCSGGSVIGTKSHAFRVAERRLRRFDKPTRYFTVGSVTR